MVRLPPRHCGPARAEGEVTMRAASYARKCTEGRIR
jgi:hypothetical protein